MGVAVWFLDNVIDTEQFLLEHIAEMVRSNWKTDPEVMGFTDMFVKLGIPYDSQQAIRVVEVIIGFISIPYVPEDIQRLFVTSHDIGY